MHFPVPTTNSTEQHTSKSIQTEAISKSHQSHSPLLGERLVGLHNPLDRREPLDSQHCKPHSTANPKKKSFRSQNVAESESAKREWGRRRGSHRRSGWAGSGEAGRGLGRGIRRWIGVSAASSGAPAPESPWPWTETDGAGGKGEGIGVCVGARGLLWLSFFRRRLILRSVRVPRRRLGWICAFWKVQIRLGFQ